MGRQAGSLFQKPDPGRHLLNLRRYSRCREAGRAREAGRRCKAGTEAVYRQVVPPSEMRVQSQQ